MVRPFVKSFDISAFRVFRIQEIEFSMTLIRFLSLESNERMPATAAYHPE
jgi:hypothetical protein